MQYRIRTEYKNGTVEFYYIFNDYGFIQYLSGKKNLKDKVGALSFAIAQSKQTVRVIMPLGTNEKEFNDKMHKFFQLHSNMQSAFGQYQGYGNSDTMDAFTSIFGNIFGG